MAKKNSTFKLYTRKYKPYGYLKVSEKPEVAIEEYKKALDYVPITLLIKEYRVECEKYGIASFKENKNKFGISSESTACLKRVIALEEKICNYLQRLTEEIEMANYYQEEATTELQTHLERKKKNVKVSRKSNK